MKKITLYVDETNEFNLNDIINDFQNRDKTNLSDYEKDKIFEIIKKNCYISNIVIDDSKIINRKDKVFFRNKYLEQKLNGLIKTLNWAIYIKNVDEKELGRILKSASTLISMKYHGFDKIEFNIGDIVECCYGTNLTGEISGGHTHAIVCDINRNDMPYLLPISKELNKANITSEKYITFLSGIDADYEEEKFKGGTIILDKGKYLAPERIIKVVGQVHPEFLMRIWKELANVYIFYNNKNNQISNLQILEEKVGKKNFLFGKELTENIGYAIKKIDKNKTIEENVIIFLKQIDISIEDKIIIQAFIAACHLEKINYENITFEVNKIYPEIGIKKIKENLKENFKKWLNNYPKLKKNYPNLAFIALLKIFAKYMK